MRRIGFLSNSMGKQGGRISFPCYVRSRTEFSSSALIVEWTNRSRKVAGINGDISERMDIGARDKETYIQKDKEFKCQKLDF
ncbi:hypothetical protein TNCV_1206631 [Trichonephila clavipes]|nr:hypothetical protein TNCV_1206631 [Trichonephila clavipes]